MKSNVDNDEIKTGLEKLAFDNGYTIDLKLEKLRHSTYFQGSGSREMYDAFVTRASKGEKNNDPIIKETLKLRKELANLVGIL